jgi:hypothetical protein
MALLQVIYPGSFVWIEGMRLGQTVRRYEKVVRRTRTQFVIEHDGLQWRYRRDDGMEIGGMHDCIVGPASVEEMAAFEELCEEERDLRRLLSGYAIELNRHDSHYEMRFRPITAAQVRALFSTFKGSR